MLTSFKIAGRFLRYNKIQTLVIILGIAIGVSVQIFIGLLSKGLESTLLNKVIGSSAHITVYSTKGGIADWQDKKNKIIKADKDIKAAAPVVDYQAFIKLNDMTEPVQIRGFIYNDVNSLYRMKDRIYEGKMLEDSGQALIGRDLKERLGVNVGDKITIITIDKKRIELTLAGFYDLGAVKVNRTWLITDLKTAQDLLGFGDKVTSIEIGVNDVYNADIVGKHIEKSLNDKKLKVENWKDQNKLLFSGLVGQKICTIIIEFFVLLAAVLSIISILGISVVQKYKQIGILKAMGIKDFSAAYIFFIQAFILGVLGTALGIWLTYTYIKYFNTYIITPEGTPVINIIVSHKFIGKSALIDIAAATLAAFFPAVNSFRLSPVEVIKNG